MTRLPAYSEDLSILSAKIDALNADLKNLNAFRDTERYIELRQEIARLGVRRHYLKRARQNFDGRSSLR